MTARQFNNDMKMGNRSINNLIKNQKTTLRKTNEHDFSIILNVIISLKCTNNQKH